jgi:hypothetical protein
MSIKLPALSEAAHPLVQPWLDRSDEELVALIQQHPHQGRYFTALFCRYGAFIYTLLSHHAKTTLQVDYLFARTWRRIFLGLTHPQTDPRLGVHSTETVAWIAEQAAATILQDPVPGVEAIQYSLAAAPPPLWCYLEAAMAEMPAETRLILLMAQNFHWSTDRIVAYLESEGGKFSLQDVQQKLAQGYQLLDNFLPEDIAEIYLGDLGSNLGSDWGGNLGETVPSNTVFP